MEPARVGWVDYVNGSTYTKSHIQALNEEGFLSVKKLNDPLAKTGSDPKSYMIWVCNDIGAGVSTAAAATQYSLYATKEASSTDSVAEAQKGCLGPTSVTTYGKNYAIGSRMW